MLIKSRVSGICGSDLGFLQGKELPAAEPFFAFPFVPGHELFGVVAAVGAEVSRFSEGDRVAIDPTLACRERGFDPVCGFCTDGHPSRCERYADGHAGPGFLIGTTGPAGGGWSEAYAAPSWRLHPVPDTVDDEEASLVEPLSICLHAVLRVPPAPGEHALVLGAGNIGLLTVAALRATAPQCRITCVAKYDFQAELAGALGADAVVSAAGDEPMDAIARALDSGSYALGGGGRLLRGGAHVTYDTVTNGVTLNQALRATRAGGQVVMLGLAGVAEGVDWTPIWMRELSLTGSFLYGTEPVAGRPRASFDVAVELLANRSLDLRAMRPKLFSLDEHDAALGLAADKASSQAAKVSFAF